MGTDAQVIVVGRPAHLLQLARDRIADLERRWSRFVDGSEISTLNRSAGAPVVVSPETVELVRRAIDAWRHSGGRFEPTVLGWKTEVELAGGMARTVDWYRTLLADQ